jgi:hypothetical protein
MALQVKASQTLALFSLAVAIGGCGGQVMGAGDSGSSTNGDSGSEDSGSDSIPSGDTSVTTDGGDDSSGDIGPTGPCMARGAAVCGTSTCTSGCAADKCVIWHSSSPSTPSLHVGFCDLTTDLLDVPEPGPGWMCTVCPHESSLCMTPDGTEPFCVFPEACTVLHNLGFTNPCFYQDKTSWNGDVALTAGACPGASSLRLCGGGCGDCSGPEVCTGRSPTHPFGVCAKPYFPTASSLKIPNECGVCKSHGMSCLTFQVGAAGPSQTLADFTGFCIEPDRCTQIAAMLPGGATCK